MNLSGFQFAVIAVFAFAAIGGVIVFATGIGLGGDKPISPVVIWGTVDQEVMDPLLFELGKSDERFALVSYVAKDERTYNEDFVDALAAGRGPDLFLLSQSAILAHRDKILTIPYDSYSERAFKNTFVREGELYLTQDGIRALPFTVDPLVMYWNRDIFSAEGISSPPSFWDEFFTLSPIITQRDRSANILRSFVAFGEYRNIVHARDILSALVLQTGNPIVAPGPSGSLSSTLGDTFEFIEPPALAALRFYTEFSNPVKSVYSWNRALPNSRQSFIAGDLALYIGFASEFAELEEANPNLNFDVTTLPHSRETGLPVTYGRMSGFAIPLGSSDPSAAFSVASVLTDRVRIAHLTDITGLPPVRRDLLGDIPTDATLPVFYEAAIASRGWLDPSPEKTGIIYKRMIENTLSGRSTLSEAVHNADSELESVLMSQ